MLPNTDLFDVFWVANQWSQRRGGNVVEQLTITYASLLFMLFTEVVRLFLSLGGGVSNTYTSLCVP